MVSGGGKPQADALRRWLAGSGLIALSFALFSGPVFDTDFWWHIASGRWMVEHRTLPTTDPLGVYASVNYWARTILQGQWLGQVLLFGIFDRFGAVGVQCLRIVTLGLALTLVARRLAATSAGWPSRWLATLAVGVVLAGFAAERPQLFALLFFSLLVALLEARRQRPRLAGLILSLLVLWTNVHQSVVLGAVVAALWIGIDAWSGWRAGQRRHAVLLLGVAVLAMLAPLATPNGLRGIEYIVWQEFEPAKARISEYASPFLLTDQVLASPPLLLYFAFLPLLVAALLRVVRQQPPAAIVPACLLLASLFAYRYTPFVILLATPLVVEQLTAIARQRRAAGAAAGALIAIPLVLALVVTLNEHTARWREGVSVRHFPHELLARARMLGVSGRLFTSVYWGGYAGWELHGQARPFIDGRFMMNTAQLDDYTHMLWATPRGRWLFEQGGFDWVLLPHRNPFSNDNQVYPLIVHLANHPAWQLRQESAQGVLFSRR